MDCSPRTIFPGRRLVFLICFASLSHTYLSNLLPTFLLEGPAVSLTLFFWPFSSISKHFFFSNSL